MSCNSENSLVDDGREQRKATERADSAFRADGRSRRQLPKPFCPLDFAEAGPNVTESQHFLSCSHTRIRSTISKGGNSIP
jgi:hypothetical protein